LSVRLLPRQIREPVALGYLLARTTDTIADTAQISTTMRMETLELVSNAIQDMASRETVAGAVTRFIPLQQNTQERHLLESLLDFLSWLDRMEDRDRNDIRAALEKITRGQMLDLARFDDAKEIHALGTATDLDEYTYLVAGCVGEFWTRLCFRHVRNFANRSEDKMLTLGKSYGMGLQLINVLRDAGTDLRAGRCYFPKQELEGAHMTAPQILAEPESFQPIYGSWLEKAKTGIQCGIEYSQAIRNRRVRAATVLPALIGARTLALLEAAGPMALQRTVKVPRHEVRLMISSLALTLVSLGKIESMAREYMAR
jgi:farnesyl-diphosphate farnesyltransferase